eukprot:m.5975 g.5975  ORF g.5975 m.5975 type:complete len:594 (+) comp4779_c0_seq1:42-1823(+)
MMLTTAAASFNRLCYSGGCGKASVCSSSVFLLYSHWVFRSSITSPRVYSVVNLSSLRGFANLKQTPRTKTVAAMRTSMSLLEGARSIQRRSHTTPSFINMRLTIGGVGKGFDQHMMRIHQHREYMHHISMLGRRRVAALQRRFSSQPPIFSKHPTLQISTFASAGLVSTPTVSTITSAEARRASSTVKAFFSRQHCTGITARSSSRFLSHHCNKNSNSSGSSNYKRIDNNNNSTGNDSDSDSRSSSSSNCGDGNHLADFKKKREAQARNYYHACKSKMTRLKQTILKLQQQHHTVKSKLMDVVDDINTINNKTDNKIKDNNSVGNDTNANTANMPMSPRKGIQRLRNARNKAIGLKNKWKGQLHITENILTIPNLLCVFRLGAAPVIAHSIVTGNADLAWWLFVTASVTDYLDGAIARRFPSQKSMMGSVLDPTADKVLVVSCAASLGLAGVMPAWLAGLILFKDATMLGATFYMRYTSLKALQSKPITVVDYFDFSRPSVVVHPNFLAKANTAIQFVLFGYLVAQGTHIVPELVHPYDLIAWGITGATTFGAGLSYAVTSDAVEFIGKRKDNVKKRMKENVQRVIKRSRRRM